MAQTSLHAHNDPVDAGESRQGLDTGRILFGQHMGVEQTDEQRLQRCCITRRCQTNVRLIAHRAVSQLQAGLTIPAHQGGNGPGLATKPAIPALPPGPRSRVPASLTR